MQELLDLLLQEEAALLVDKLDDIEQLTPVKTDIIDKLQKSNESRMLNFSNLNSSVSFPDWIENHHNQSLAKAWTELMALASKAKEINSTNSLLLNQLAIRNQRYLSFLKGDNQEEVLYGRNGLNSYKSTGHTIKG
jgi:flagella synthesis protein FlgN